MAAVKPSGGLKATLVYGANVGQAFQYAATGATDVSFVAMSLAQSPQGKNGCLLEINEAEPVVQSGCIVTAGEKKENAGHFMAFVLSEAAQPILEQYGYTSP